MEKYYTPEIEEFHIGFEYESARLSNKDPWRKKVATITDIDEAEACLTHFPEEKIIRVKYLDRDDIESLGWKEVLGGLSPIATSEEGVTSRRLYEKQGYFLTKWDNSLFVQIIKAEEYLFQGNVKNKSKLKDILKMVGI